MSLTSDVVRKVFFFFLFPCFFTSHSAILFVSQHFFVNITHTYVLIFFTGQFFQVFEKEPEKSAEMIEPDLKNAL
jgi:Na+/phosphate symporter